MSIGTSPEVLSQRILAGRILVGRSGARSVHAVGIHTSHTCLSWQRWCLRNYPQKLRRQQSETRTNPGSRNSPIHTSKESRVEKFGDFPSSALRGRGMGWSVYMYIYIYIERERDVYIHIYIYIYIERERYRYVCCSMFTVGSDARKSAPCRCLRLCRLLLLLLLMSKYYY